MDQLRFDEQLGAYSVSVAPESIGIAKAMGTHCLRLQLAVGIPEVGPAAGRLLYLETDLCAPQPAGSTVPIAFANVSVPFRPTGEIRRVTPQYLITNAQLLALEQLRLGDLRLELHIRGFLPQASGYPGSNDIVEYIAIAESRWRQQLAGLGRTLGVDMVIPFPTDQDPRHAVAEFLREAQRQLGSNEIESAMLHVRKALEAIRTICDWGWPGKKAERERTGDERWAWIRAALEHQASGALHEDAGTKDYRYSRAEVEALIGMTAALVTIVT